MTLPQVSNERELSHPASGKLRKFRKGELKNLTISELVTDDGKTPHITIKNFPKLTKQELKFLQST